MTGRKRRGGALTVPLLVRAANGLAGAATFSVNNTADMGDVTPGDGVCETGTGNGICTLRAAIREANALAGADVITLPAGTYMLAIAGRAADAAATGDLDVTRAVTVNGAGAGTTIIDGAALDRVFDVQAGANLAINDVTVQNGKFICGGFCSSEGGGGFRTVSGTLTITGCTVTGNSTNGSLD